MFAIGFLSTLSSQNQGSPLQSLLPPAKTLPVIVFSVPTLRDNNGFFSILLGANLSKMYLYLDGPAPPAERFQSLCDLVSTSSQAWYYIRCRMSNDVWPSFAVFFNLYLWLQVEILKYGQHILKFDNNSHCEVRIAEMPLKVRTGQMKGTCLSSICSDQLNAEDFNLEKCSTTLLFIFLWLIAWIQLQKHVRITYSRKVWIYAEYKVDFWVYHGHYLVNAWWPWCSPQQRQASADPQQQGLQVAGLANLC